MYYPKFLSTAFAAIAIGFYAFACSSVRAQSIAKGDITVRFEQYGDANFGATGFFSPSDFAPLADGTGRNLVTLIDGTGRLLDADGNLLDDGNYLPNLGIGFPVATGIAVHPDFAQNGKIYQVTNGSPNLPADFGISGSSTNQVIEWTADDPSSNNPAFTRRDILRVSQPTGSHNLTDLAFDQNGLLYISVGDGGPPSTSTAVLERAQDLTNIFGTMIRIDPINTTGEGLITSANGHYGIPTSNIGSDGDVSSGTIDEIYAFGLRSPYRFTFDRLNDNLYLGDVGSAQVEEINLIEAGGNYGWGRFEGVNVIGPSITLAAENPVHSPPLFGYGRDGSNVAGDGDTVVGGFVYRGTAIPDLVGKYIFADFGLQQSASQDGSPSRVFYADLDVDGTFVDGSVRELLFDIGGEQIVTTDPAEITLPGAVNGQSLSFVYSIGEDVDGELFLLVGENFGGAALALDPRGRVLRFLPGPEAPDYDADGDVDGDDLVLLVDRYGLGDTNGAEFLEWQRQYTGELAPLSNNVPEPTCALLLLIGLASTELLSRQTLRRVQG